jgi:hypothetical protein
VGLFANDLAISGPSPPQSREEYDAASQGSNIGGLVWRVEYDQHAKILKPSRPVVRTHIHIHTHSQRGAELLLLSGADACMDLLGTHDDVMMCFCV